MMAQWKHCGEQCEHKPMNKVCSKYYILHTAFHKSILCSMKQSNGCILQLG